MITAVSLFAGVGGFDLALERAGVKVVASVEWDKNAQEVLRRHFPDSTIFGDISGVTGEQLIAAGFEPRNGIITGGFPCQDLSVAGKRAGLGGQRSGLFWEIGRILDETRAQNFILENVPGLLSSNQGADMAVVLEALVKRGYRIAYRVLDAKYFGVPQRRRRVFIVGSLGNSGRSPEEILDLAQGRAGYLKARGKTRKNSATTIANSIGNDRGREINESFLFHATRNEKIRIYEHYSPALAVAGWLRGLHVFSMHGAMIGRNDAAGPSGSGFLGDNEPSYTLTASSQARHGVVIVPMVFEPKSAFEENWAESEVKNALRANASKSSHAIVQESNVRRLTPIECERLQGFPDNWTDGQTDGHRYKQMGNAVAVPVVQWIINRMVESNA